MKNSKFWKKIKKFLEEEAADEYNGDTLGMYIGGTIGTLMMVARMFSKRVIGSARFLKMPISTQCLYFHLGLNADDDGIVEAYTTIKQIGATEDDLKVLVAKGFCTVLNEDLVTYITDWRENNKLRADRKIDSIYKDLLLQMVPDADVQQARRRADLKPLAEGGRPLDRIG